MNILLVDNYDSFTFNLQHYLRSFNAGVTVLRNNDPQLATIDLKEYSGVVISPGPGKPSESGMLQQFISGVFDKISLLGVCLGHQAIGELAGAELVQAGVPMHGKISVIQHSGHKMFQGVPQQFKTTRYHSLILKNLKPELFPTAFATTGELMAFAHKSLPVWGVQFHPEAVSSSFGHQIINNWLHLCRHKNSF